MSESKTIVCDNGTGVSGINLCFEKVVYLIRSLEPLAHFNNI